MTPPVKLERCPVTDARSAMLDRLRDEGDEYASAFNNGVRAAIAMYDSYTAMHQASPIAEGIVSEEVEELLNELDGWEGAYPLSVFPEPDFARAAQLLKAGGMTLDAISASNMRHVVSKIAPKARAAIAALRTLSVGPHE
jgi:hypothetical protein